MADCRLPQRRRHPPAASPLNHHLPPRLNHRRTPDPPNASTISFAFPTKSAESSSHGAGPATTQSNPATLKVHHDAQTTSPPIHPAPASTLLLTTLIPHPALADSFDVSFYGAGVQSSPASAFVESFDTAVPSAGTLTTSYSGSPLTGTYTGGFSLFNADIFGGAGGGGRYITTFSTYSLSLSSSVNYFGMWFSALDQGNQLSFYDGSTLLYSFTPAAFSALVGACPSASGFCGNPNNGANSGQQYAFLNFFDPTGSFNKITFTEDPAIGGFESDNHTVGNLSTSPGGTPIDSPVPEPSSLLLLGTGAAALAGTLRRRLSSR